jgi:segregation and condensation protein B
MTDRRTPQEPVALLLAGLGLAEPRRPPEPTDRPLEPTDRSAPASPPVPSHLEQLDARIEALLLVSDGPLALTTIATAVDRPVAVVRQAVERLRDDYEGRGAGRRRGFELREVATGWRLYARIEHDEAVRSLAEAESPGRLSQAALETLAVIAYRQPVSRGQVAAIRAVSVDSVIRTLQSRGLIEEVGRSEETGAALYGTTDELLVALGLRSIDELPPIAPLLSGAEGAYEHAG